MKIIITESQYNLLRRIPEIDNIIKDYFDDDAFVYRLIERRINFDDFIGWASYTIATMVIRTEIAKDDNDDLVMHRNQLQRFIKNNYYEYFKKRYKELYG